VRRLTFDLDLPQELYADLITDCTNCSCSPKQWAAEAVEAAIASRRLPKVEVGTHGAFTSGWRGDGHEDEREFEDAAEAGLVVHGFLL